jgi:hypothetical protein
MSTAFRLIEKPLHVNRRLLYPKHIVHQKLQFSFHHGAVKSPGVFLSATHRGSPQEHAQRLLRDSSLDHQRHAPSER